MKINKLNRSERHEVYIRALDLLDIKLRNGNLLYLCIIIRRSVLEYIECNDPDVLHSTKYDVLQDTGIWDELVIHKPAFKPSDSVWWEVYDYKSRRDVLVKLMRSTRPTIFNRLWRMLWKKK